jgi:hypothetical protein
MKFLLKVWSSNPNFDYDCDMAFVEIDKQLAQIALRRIDLLQAHQAADDQLYESYYWCYWPEWLKCSPETFVVDLELNEVIPAPADFHITGDDALVWTECGQMIVRKGAIAFTAIPKYCSSYLSTAEIERAELEAIAYGEEEA